MCESNDGKNFRVTIDAQFVTLAQKVYFQTFVLEALNEVLEDYSDDLTELGNIKRKGEK